MNGDEADDAAPQDASGGGDAAKPQTVWDVRLHSGIKLGTLKTITIWIFIGILVFSQAYAWWVSVRVDGEIDGAEYWSFPLGIAAWLLFSLMIAWEFRRMYRRTLKEFEVQRHGSNDERAAKVPAKSEP